jgi:hypothetical protein
MSMNAATETRTETRLADLTSANLIKPSYIENGRRKWEAKRAGDLIKMFAAGGYDVITPTDHPKETRNPYRLVKDQNGVIIANILWSLDVPDFAYAFTSGI